jgi:FMN phosphatase YigB (HAD superfamily)
MTAPAIVTGSRPLIVCDCDEVLLHMVSHFRDWLFEEEGVRFSMDSGDFGKSMFWQDRDLPVEQADIWRLLNKFFDTEMGRQYPIEGAVQAVAALSDRADVVILTNLLDHRRDRRARQLAEHGIGAEVFTNQGPKGPAIRALADRFQPSRTIFIDDLPQHHRSARETLPGITTLHLCGEPMIAPHIDCAHRAGHADARIDAWADALPWLIERLENNE